MTDDVGDESDVQPFSIKVGTSSVAIIAIVWNGYLLWTLALLAL